VFTQRVSELNRKSKECGGIKIYYIANARMPTEKAHGIQLAKMCEAFIEQGVDLELVVPRRKTSAKSIKDFYDLRVDVPVAKLGIIDWYVRGRVGFFIASFSFAVRYFFYLLKKRLQGERFIIYMTDIDQFSFFLIPFLGVSYFCEIHDAKPRRVAFRLLFNYADGIIVINEIIKRGLMETFGIASRCMIVHSNGIDLGMYAHVPLKQEARYALGIPAEKKIVLYVGGFYEWKGLNDVIEALRYTGEDEAFYFVGGSREELMRATGESDIPDSVRCVGHKPFIEVPMWLAAADLLLVLGTKKNQYSYLHTSPMKSFEYMASGVPILASATPANREILSDKDALMYEPDSARDLAGKISYAFSHADEMKKRADHAREKVKQFSWDKRVESILRFMKNNICE